MPWLKFEYNTDQVGGGGHLSESVLVFEICIQFQDIQKLATIGSGDKKKQAVMCYGILQTYLKYEHFESGSVFRFQGGLDPDRLKRLQIRNSQPMEYRSSCNPYYLFLKCRSACYIKVVIFCENHHTTKFLHLPAMWTGKPFKAPVIG